MNRQRLEYFSDLAETLNYTETAERLYTSQGNVSKQIMALEKELGVQLFVREHRKIKLTEIGWEILDRVERILTEFEEMDQLVEQYHRSSSNQIVLHGIPTMSSYRITELIGQFFQQCPQYQLLVEEEEGRDLSRSLQKQTCQLIFNRYFEEELPEEEYLVVDEDELVVVLPKNHPLSTRQELCLEDLKEETFFQIGYSSKLYDKMIEACQQAGFRPKISYQGRQMNYILEFVAQNMGISLMMRKSVKQAIEPNLVMIPLHQDQRVTCRLCLVKGEWTSSAVEKLWAFVAEQIVQ